ncbi:MAG: mechanosensitive ion channel family protein [Euryarchaeota archaeon]|nr:mechanosensitive ion channel family protein [Euryarchaeota archaeon]
MAFPNDLYDVNSTAAILLRVVVIIAVTIIVARFFEVFSNRYLQQAAIRLKVNPTKYVALKRLIIASIYIVAVMALIALTPQLQSLSVALFASVSIIGIIIGIAAQSTLSNVIAGIAIVVFKPFGVQDFVTVRGESGFVEDITFRHTVIRLIDRHMIIPNSVMTNEVIFNHSNDHISGRLDVRVSYDSDLLLVKRLMREEVEKVCSVDEGSIVVNVSRTDELGVTLSLIFRSEESPFTCAPSLREAVIIRLLNERVALR